MSTIFSYYRFMKQKRRLIYQLNTARHTMMKSMDAGCKEALDVSVVQLSALIVVNENNGSLMKDLASSLMLDKSAVTGLAKRMQERGLIKKVACSEDSRASRLMITKQGKNSLYQGLSLLKGINSEMQAGFTEQELDTVSRFLSHITTMFSKKN
jgi:DNA-binding MarR family transcriptional regulator